jgi:hemolysin activation/secretion protein
MRALIVMMRGPAAGILPLALTAPGALAQLPDVGPGLTPPELPRPGEERPALPEFVPPQPREDLELPPPLAPAEGLPPVRRGPAFVLRDIRFEGNTVLSDEELAAIAAPYVGRPVTAEDLEELRREVTLAYVEEGYINSGAVLPDQTIADGTITIRIIEGRLAEITVTGADGLRESFISERLRLGTGWVPFGTNEPLNVNVLQDRFRILLQDPLIDQLNGRLGPGLRPGDARLDVDVARARPLSVALTVDNNNPPSTGSLTGRIGVVARNLSGWGDVLQLNYYHTRGADDISGYAAVPVTPYDTTVFFSGEVGDSSIIEEPLRDIDVRSEFWDVTFGVRQPVYRTPEQELDLELRLSRRHSETFLLGRPFAFAPGAIGGESDITVLRFVQEWTDRSPERVIAARSTVSWGIDVLGATNNRDLPDGQFVAWLGQAQLAQRFETPLDRDIEVIARTDVQLANDPLLPLEKFAVGGRDTVRGYRENELVRDNGVVASIEGRIPLIDLGLPDVETPGYQGRLVFAPFLDWGLSWNNGRFGDEEGKEQIAGIGAGLRWDPAPWLYAEFYYGYALNELREENDDLQDRGIYFRVTVQPL